MDQLWTSLLDFLNKLVSPDWGALIALLPIALLGLVALYVLWTVRRFATVGPRDRVPVIRPIPPRGVHMPGPSWAPIFGAVGMFLLLYGIVFPGPLLVAGVAVLTFALVFWLREAIRDYDHVEHPQTALVAIAAQAPPPGLHLPGPSFRPILVSISMAALLFSLVFGGWLYLAAFLMLVISMVQWLMDARREYRGVVIADRTGHIPAEPRPGYPVPTLITFAVLLFGAIFLNAGILPPKSDAAAPPSGAVASPAPSAGGGGGSVPGASGVPPSPGSGGQAADVTIAAENISFVGTSVTGPAGKPFTIDFHNNDAGIPHNVSIRQGGPTGTELWKGEIFPGVDSRLYQVTPLQPGTYSFVCDVHPNMTGQITIQ